MRIETYYFHDASEALGHIECPTELYPTYVASNGRVVLFIIGHVELGVEATTDLTSKHQGCICARASPILIL